MKIILTVLKKELMDMFRDRKTIIASILIPLLMYPVLFGIMGRGIQGSMDFIDEGFEIGIVDKSNSSLGKFISDQENITTIETEDPRQAVSKGELLLSVEIPEDFDQVLQEEGLTKVRIIYDDTSQKSNTAMSHVNGLINTFSKAVVSQRLEEKNIDSSILTPIETITESSEKEESGFGALMLSLMLPMMLMLFAATGPVASATDLGAGEKERGTLEPLLSTQASRISLLWGKFLAITIMGVLTSIAFISGLGFSMKMSPEAFGYGIDNVSISLQPSALLIIALFTVLLTMVFGALCLAVSMYARSFKEAQTYLTPFSMIGLLGFTSSIIEPKTMSAAMLHIPLVNIVAVLKELTLGIYDIGHILIVFGWIIVYIIAAIAFARYMFSKESVIFRT